MKDEVTPLNPGKSREPLREPGEFGDDWKQPLEPDEKARLTEYFKRFEHLRQNIDFVRFLVGGTRRSSSCAPGPAARPHVRGPARIADDRVAVQIFDDLLIGNFMKVTLHGDWGPGRLYPDFSPWVAK